MKPSTLLLDLIEPSLASVIILWTKGRISFAYSQINYCTKEKEQITLVTVVRMRSFLIKDVVRARNSANRGAVARPNVRSTWCAIFAHHGSPVRHEELVRTNEDTMAEREQALILENTSNIRTSSFPRTGCCYVAPSDTCSCSSAVRQLRGLLFARSDNMAAKYFTFLKSKQEWEPKGKGLLSIIPVREGCILHTKMFIL